MAQTMEDGRELQFDEMMQALEAFSAKYAGVRGQLLSKVKEELMRLKPGAVAPKAPAPVAKAEPVKLAPVAVAVAEPVVQSAAIPQPKKTPTSHMLPSCRKCGRSMREAGDGSLVCQNGHTRMLAG